MYKDRKHNRKRKRSQSPERSSKQPLEDYKYDLQTFLEDQCNIRNHHDFWQFYIKYEATQRLHKPNTNVDYQLLINQRFKKSHSKLYEKLPLYTKSGKRIKIDKESCEFLLKTVLVYQDFQQKQRFAKLKSLRNTQKDLPITHYKNVILESIEKHSVVLIAGDTGCGKSTQVPQYVREAGYKKIACTQPRRLACIALSHRVAYETLTQYANQIGYQIRFEKAKNQNTNVCFMTEGILLRQSDSETILSYDVIILDEIHERHLNMDFLIGLMKCLLRKKKFKLVLMSATINLKLFQDYFADEGVETIKVPGRLFPIDIIYKPIVKEAKAMTKFYAQPYLNLLEMIDAKYQGQKGDVLIFLNGFQEISQLKNAVEQYCEATRANWIVLQLHSTLSIEEQDKVFHITPENHRKCILSTNIAETSLTIDGIRFVIDSGKVNRMYYDLTSHVNKLIEVDISQDSAKQRAGRAGRTGPGICYRLYSEHDLANFEAFTPAEIYLVPLEHLILSMITLGLTNVEKFPFVERPPIENLRSALDRLIFLQALTQNVQSLSLTQLGITMNKLPVDLIIAKMLIISTIFGTTNAILALASLISVQTPLIESKYYETRDQRGEFVSNHGEIITLLNLYKAWLMIKRSNQQQSRQWCRLRGIEEQRFYEVSKLASQFREILQEAELIPKLDNGLNASERAIRHGELKNLKKMRAELKMNDKNTRKKLLKKQGNDDDDNNDNRDLRDVEFHISNDFRKLDALILETKTTSFNDLMLVKIILTSAFYPQIAVEDEFNSSKTVNERLYHTKSKNYVFLRPTSYFAENPEFLQLNDAQIDIPPAGYFSKLPLSRHHQLLIFQKLLETKKTFIMNTYRMPMLQTLLLFGRKIATNRHLTRFVIDDFIMINCPFLFQGKVILTKAILLREEFTKKLNQRLDNALEITNCDELINELLNYMQSEVSYNYKRLLPADVKTIYTLECDFDAFIDNPFLPGYTSSKNNQIGGINVTENVIYDCLAVDNYDCDVEQAILQSPYNCSKCNQNISVHSVLDMLKHDANCRLVKVSDDDDVKPTTSKANTRVLHCDKCDKDLVLSTVEFLRHRKRCGTDV